MKPEVTIYITNHNYSDYLSKAIDSCLNQTFKNIEIIIIDDGSTDGSQEIINTYASSHQNIIPIFKKIRDLSKHAILPSHQQEGSLLYDWMQMIGLIRMR